MEQKHIKALIFILAIIWVILLFIAGVIPVTLAVFKPMGFVTAIAIFLIGAFDKWIWKWKILHSWFVPIPNLSGTWKAGLDSNWVDKATGEGSKDIEAYFIIEQTFSSIKVTLLTKESSSELISGQLFKDKNNGKYYITGIYLNEPKMLKKDSPMHYGALRCNVMADKRAVTIEGNYWTDRQTKGEIHFLKHSPHIYHNFDECKKHLL